MIRENRNPEIEGYAADGLVACPACDAAYRMVELPAGGQAECRRCGAVLYRDVSGGLERASALYLTALILFVLANGFPFVSLRYGDRVEQTQLLSGGFALQQAGMGELGVLVLMTSIVFPLLCIGGMVYLLLPLRRGVRPPGMVAVWRLVRALTPWSLMGVFMLGLLVSVVKLQDLAAVVPGLGFYAFVALLVVLAAAAASFDPAVVWPRLGPRVDCPDGASTASLGYAVCSVCALPVSLGNGTPAHCPRCQCAVRGARQPDSLSRTWALLAASALLLIPANLYPVMTVIRFGQGEPSTILAGVVHLIEDGAWPLGLLVFFASFIVPLTKLCALGFLLVGTARGSAWRLRDRTRLYRATEAIGSWSMIDVFLVAILVSLVRMDALASVQPGIGASFFAAAVVLTMIAAHTFDPRLLWDHAGRPARETA